jgi:hypothetical protein
VLVPDLIRRVCEAPAQPPPTKEELDALAFNHWYLWGGLLGLLWLICLLSAGVLTWKHGHSRVLFFIGFIFPIVWRARADHVLTWMTTR